MGLIYFKNIKDFLLRFSNHYYPLYKKEFNIIIIILILLLILPETVSFFKLANSHHFESKFIFTRPDNSIKDIFEYLRIEGNNPVLFELILKTPSLIQKISLSCYNYLSTLSLNFLFTHGDTCLRHHVTGRGALPFIDMILLPARIITCLFKIKEFKYKTLIMAFIAIGIPSALIVDLPEYTHNFHMFIVYSVIASIGLVNITKKAIKTSWLKVLTYTLAISLAIMSFVIYLGDYYGDYKNISRHEWQAYRDKVFNYVISNRNKYSNIYFSGQLHEVRIHYLFYAASKYHFNPAMYQQKSLLPFNAKMLEQVLFFPNIQRDSLHEFYGKNSIYVLNEKELPGYPLIKTYYYPKDICLCIIKAI
jgi:hypothetical protein